MSDFDREAERERLREKYEQDREKRESTQRMSELLLRGATMTDSHCDSCGDPIFRYEGQEFCATCRAGDGEAAAAADETDPPADDGADAGRAAPAPETAPDPAPEPTGGRAAEPASDRAGGVADARASLERTLARFARRAETAESPREATDHLAAAREAAEALAALRR
jgi:uncharacterized Zn finger protein (UPF0148 family)